MSSLSLLREYLPILIYLAVSIFVGMAAVGLSWIAAKQQPDSSKLSPYEC